MASVWYNVALPSTPPDSNSKPWISRLDSVFSTPHLVEIDLPLFSLPTFGRLLELSDQLDQVDRMADAALGRMQQAFMEYNAEPQARTDLPVVVMRAVQSQSGLLPDGIPADAGLIGFRWDSTRFPPNQPLERTISMFQKAVTSFDGPLKQRISAVRTAVTRMENAHRLSTGPVTARDIGVMLPSPTDHIETAHMTTRYVVVPRYEVSKFLASYESFTEFVVPGSALELASDAENAIFRVVVFLRDADAFATACREKRYGVRLFIPRENEVAAATENQLKSQLAQAQIEVVRWSRASYAPMMQLRLHIHFLHLYVEASSRYGVPSSQNSLLFLAIGASGHEKQARIAMNRAFGPAMEKMAIEAQTQKAVFDDPEADFTSSTYLPYVAFKLILTQNTGKYLTQEEFQALVSAADKSS